MIALLGGGILAAGLGVGALAHDGPHQEGEKAKAVTIQGELNRTTGAEDCI